MGYIEDEAMVRVDFFRKGSCKWCTTAGIKWLTYETEPGKEPISIHEAFREALQNSWYADKLDDCFAVCLEPYHQHAHPLILWDWKKEVRK